MIKKMLLSVVSVVVIVFVCFAADVTGRWKGRINDQFDVVYDFKSDSTKLTGTTTDPDGNVIDIKDGMIKGDSVSFILPLMGSDVPVKGDVMSLTMTFNGNPGNFELKKEAAGK